MDSLLTPSTTSPMANRTVVRSESIRLLLARVEWFVLMPLTLAIFVSALPARYEQLQAESARYRNILVGTHPNALPPLFGSWLSSSVYAPSILALEILVMAVSTAAAIILFWRGHDERMAVLASFALLTYSALFLPPLDALAEAHPALAVLPRLVQGLGLVSSLLIFYISPDGHFVPRWTRPLAVLWILWTVVGLLAPSSVFNLANGRLHVATPSVYPLSWLLINMSWWSTGVLAQVVRFRHVSTPQQRQQTKWVLVGWIAVIIFYSSLALPRLLVPAFSAPGSLDMLYRGVAVPAFEATLMLSPIPITISMLRYRLWDVDFVINRAIVYGLVTLALGLVYALSIIVFETIFRSVTSLQSSLAIVLSTLASAFLFQPVHRRTQRAVDRRFYRRKYDTARMIDEFGRGVRDEVELGALMDSLVAVVQQGMQPEHASVILLPARTGRDDAQQLALAGPPADSRADHAREDQRGASAWRG